MAGIASENMLSYDRNGVHGRCGLPRSIDFALANTFNRALRRRFYSCGKHSLELGPLPERLRQITRV